MKLIPILDSNIRSRSLEELEHFLLDRMIKLRKLKAEMDSDMKVQKALEDLIIAKTPFKKAASKWKSEIDAVELELKSRNIKFDIDLEEIFEFEH